MENSSDRNPISHSGGLSDATSELALNASDSSKVTFAYRDINYWYPQHSDRSAEQFRTHSIDVPLTDYPHQLRGRDELLAILEPSLVRVPPTPEDVRPGARVHVLHGLGGCGKSRIAQQVALQAISNGREMWWIDARGAARISSGLREVAGRLGADASQVDLAWSGKRSAADLLWDHLDALQSPWLLIFDNADEPDLLGPSGRPVSDGTGWLRPPGTAIGRVLITSRNGSEGAWGAWAELHHVDVVDPAAGALILLDYAGPDAGPRAEAHRLAERLGGLPLALRAAGSYLAGELAGPVWRSGSTTRTFAEYQAALDRAMSESWQHPREVGPEEQAVMEVVHQTSELSLTLLEKSGLVVARPLLKLLACFADAPLPYAAVLSHLEMRRTPLFAGITSAQLRATVRGLSDMALVELGRTAGVADPTYSHQLTIHPLVRSSCLMGCDDGDLTGYQGLLIDLLMDATTSLDPDDAQRWTSWLLLSPHCADPLLRVLQRRTALELSRRKEALRLIRAVARYIIASGLPHQGELFLRKVLRLEAAQAQDCRKEVLSVRHEYARSLLEQGKLKAAEAEFGEVLDARAAILGSAHADCLATRHKLGRSLLEQGRWAEAEGQFSVVVAGERVLRGESHPDTLTVRHSLARALLQLGRMEEAEREIQEIAVLWEQRGEANAPEALKVRHSLARTLLGHGRAQEAERLLREVLAARLQLWGPLNLETLALRLALADALDALGRGTESAAERLTAERGSREVLGLDISDLQA
ncbi:tetratricopeptide repeat protein [Streptomyces collinus]|uniref:tetratricopeptide repeat protein n=1 Tax=Streptomyces collinus TaxID=42684 RepID=UPI00341E9E43